MASRARSPGRLAAPAAGGRLPGLGLVTHRRHFNAASQRSHTGEPPTRHIFSSRRAAVRAHSISKNGVRRRPPRPPHAPSGSVPLGQTGGVRDKRQFNTEKPNSPQMRVLPPAPANQSRRRGPRMAKANARRPPAAVEPLPPFEPCMSVCRRLWRGQWRCEICARKWWAGERVGRRKRADSRQSAKCGLLVSHLLLVSPGHGRRFPGRSPSPAPRPSPRPSSSSLPPLRPLRRSRRAGSWPDARDAGADLLRALRPGPPPLLPPGCYP